MKSQKIYVEVPSANGKAPEMALRGIIRTKDSEVPGGRDLEWENHLIGSLGRQAVGMNGEVLFDEHGYVR